MDTAPERATILAQFDAIFARFDASMRSTGQAERLFPELYDDVVAPFGPMTAEETAARKAQEERHQLELVVAEMVEEGKRELADDRKTRGYW